jgi:hypothetical protein
LVGRDVPVPIHRYIVASAKLVRVAINIGVSLTKLLSVSITINLNISHAARREVSLAINRDIVISRANGLVSLEVSFPKLLIPREVLLARRGHPRVLAGHRV